MSSIVKFRKKREKFSEKMAKRTHFSEAEIERLVEIHKDALVSEFEDLIHV